MSSPGDSVPPDSGGTDWKSLLRTACIVLFLLVLFGLSHGLHSLGQMLTALTVAVVGSAVILVVVLFSTREERFLRFVAWLGRKLPGGSRRAPPAVDDQPFPLPWEKAIRHNVGLYARLLPAEQLRLQRLIVGFLDGKEWVGCNGLEMTDEIKATVAAQACILLLGRPDHDHFASVRSILVYPTTITTGTHHHGVEDEVAIVGQAVYRGPVVLCWDEVLLGGQDPDGGRNVVYHEFAHQLDFAGETLDEATAAEREAKRQARNQVMQAEYEALVRATVRHEVTLLDGYGATNEREFFAVATECFFEKPIEMQESHVRLYEVLRDYYGQDPAERLRRYRAMAASTERRDRLWSHREKGESPWPAH